MRPERAMWLKLSQVMEGHWNATRHEDSVNKGIPDVSFGCCGVQGWIELKTLTQWPKNAATPIRIPGFSPDQKAFLRMRGLHGGCCWLLFKVGSDWMLFHHSMVNVLDGMTKEQLLATSALAWEEMKMNPQTLKNAFTNRSVIIQDDDFRAGDPRGKVMSTAYEKDQARMEWLEETRVRAAEGARRVAVRLREVEDDRRRQTVKLINQEDALARIACLPHDCPGNVACAACIAQAVMEGPI